MFIKELLLRFTDNLVPENYDEIQSYLRKKYHGLDAWGLDVTKTKIAISSIFPFYKNYFRVRVFGQENLTDKNYMIVSNHSGQIAIDGALISTAFLCDVKPPRILRPMVERFFVSLPFIGAWAMEAGAVLGDRQNCLNLLNRKESVLVFPEGVRGVSKSTHEFYKLKNFTKGFYRLALETKTEIVPIAVIGAEEFYPLVYQLKPLAKLFGLPALPITPTFPFFGLLGAIPLPSPVDIYIGKPIKIPEDHTYETPDKIISEEVLKIEKVIQEMINEGLEKRRNFFGMKK